MLQWLLSGVLLLELAVWISALHWQLDSLYCMLMSIMHAETLLTLFLNVPFFRLQKHKFCVAFQWLFKKKNYLSMIQKWVLYVLQNNLGCHMTNIIWGWYILEFSIIPLLLNFVKRLEIDSVTVVLCNYLFHFQYKHFISSLHDYQIRAQTVH